MATRYIGITHKVDGVLTDATSVVLQDPTGTYGIKRNDTDAAVVAAGTALTKQSTGTYRYTFTEPAEGVAYTAYVMVTYGGLTHYYERDLSAYTSGSDLTLQYSALRREIGRFLGYGRDPDDWDSDQTQDVTDIIAGGLRQFYWHPPVEGRDRHEWSFLRPSDTLTLVAGTSNYSLPADFGSLVDEFTYGAGDNLSRMTKLNPEQLRQKQTVVQTGDPTCFAVKVKAHASGANQRYEVDFYPTPSVSRTLTYRYSISPDVIDATDDYPRGGAVHAETILESCLAVAEKTLNDEEGVHYKRFMERLAASIELDLHLIEPGESWSEDYIATDLGITKAYLMRLVGRELGLGADPRLWDFTQRQKVETVLQAGLRKFYNPPILPGRVESHDWTFLRPVRTLTTAEDDYDYDLPVDFVCLEGPLTYAPTESVIFQPIKVLGEHQLRLKIRDANLSGRPTVVAERVKDTHDGRTRHELLCYPVPDDEYEIQYRSRINPGMLVDDASVPAGGQEHAQTLIESCLAAAEEFDGNAEGPHQKRFREYLAASVARDRRSGAPQSLGQNIDRSGWDWDTEIYNPDQDVIGYGGVTY